MCRGSLYACHRTGALNFRDVMLAYGKLSKQAMAHDRGGSNIGFEFSGHLVSDPFGSSHIS